MERSVHPSLMKHPSAWLPLAMSLAALALVLGYFAAHGNLVETAVTGTDHRPDEGAAAHLFQLLIVLQVPIVGYFALKWLPSAPAPALRVITLQLAAVLAALATLYWFESGPGAASRVTSLPVSWRQQEGIVVSPVGLGLSSRVGARSHRRGARRSVLRPDLCRDRPALAFGERHALRDLPVLGLHVSAAELGCGQVERARGLT